MDIFCAAWQSPKNHEEFGKIDGALAPDSSQIREDVLPPCPRISMWCGGGVVKGVGERLK